jgi:hypothetical protein
VGTPDNRSSSMIRPGTRSNSSSLPDPAWPCLRAVAPFREPRGP